MAKHFIKLLFFSKPWKAPKQGAPKEFGEGKAATTPMPAQAAGTFVTPASIVTFAGATCAVIILTTFLGLLFPSLKEGQPKIITTVCWSVVIGIALFMVNTEDAEVRPKTKGQWLIACIVSLVNIAYISTASLGIPLAFGNSPSSETSTNPAYPTTAVTNSTTQH